MAQPLFANQRETNLSSTVALVEEILAELGHDPGAARQQTTAGQYAWRIRTGSAVTTISLFPTADFIHMRCEAVVMTLDNTMDRGTLFAHLLGLNLAMCGNAFALNGDHVVIVAERSTLDIDRSEVRDIITRVTTNADKHDDQLVATFGGRVGEA